MIYNGYKFVLWTCASSENEVTGEDIDLKERFECDLQGVDIRPDATLFSPKIVERKYGSSMFEQKVFPDFNFTVVEARKDGLVLKSSFAYSSYSSTFEITYDSPKHTDGFWFGRYSYSYRLTFEKI